MAEFDLLNFLARDYHQRKAGNRPAPGTGGMMQGWLEGVAQRASNPGQSLLDMLSQAYGYGDQAQMMAAYNPQTHQFAPQGLPVGIGGFPLLGGATVFHGTPHVWPAEPGFPQGRPRLDKIGTGEGAQVYGHGIYFAENPITAESYWEALTSGKDKKLVSGSVEAELPDWLINNTERYGIDNSIAIIKDRLEEQQRRMTTSIQPWLEEANIARMENTLKALDEIKRSESYEVKVPGATYKTDLPDEKIPDMLDLDSPLKDQPTIAKLFGPRFPQDVPALEALRLLVLETGSPEAASNILKESGIPGAYYLDQGSRSAGGGTKNYVVWDQDILNRMVPMP